MIDERLALVDKSSLEDLSVIVPVHKLKDREENLLRWLCSPKTKYLEIILVLDDLSNEEVEMLSLDTLSNEHHVTVIRGKFASPGAARNAAIPMVRRKWVSFWDFDDFPHLEEIERMMIQVLESRCKVAMGAYEVIKVKFEKPTVSTHFRSESKVMRSNSPYINPGLWRFIFHVDLVTNQRFCNLSRGEDQIFLADLLVFDREILNYPEVIYSYFVGDPQQVTADKKTQDDLLSSAIVMRNKSRKEHDNTRQFALLASILTIFAYLKRTRLTGILRIFQLRLLFVPFIHFFSLEISRKIELFAYVQSKFLSKQNGNNSTEVFLLGGLGNQLFQLAYVMNLPKSENIILQQPCSEVIEIVSNNNLFPQSRVSIICRVSRRQQFARNLILRISSKVRPIPYGIRAPIFSAIWFLFSGKILNPKSFRVPNGVGFDKELLKIPQASRQICIGYFQTFRWSNDLVKILRDYSNEKFSQVARIDEILDKFEDNAETFIQVRRGDYKSKSNRRIGLLSEDYFMGLLQFVTRKAEESNIVVFSDEELDIPYLRDAFGPYSFVIIPRDLPLLANLYLMTKAKTLIISNSTFGWWGAMMCTPNVDVFAPKPWFRELPEPNDLIPDSWHRASDGKWF